MKTYSWFCIGIMAEMVFRERRRDSMYEQNMYYKSMTEEPNKQMQ